MKKIKILFTGGGTGGHLFPIISIVRELKRLSSDENLALHYIGPKDHKSLFLLQQENIKPHMIVSGKIRRYFSFENVTDALFKIPFGFLQSFFLLLFMRPRVVFSKGGSASLVVTMAARILFIPVFLHESDTIPGLSNRYSSLWAKKIFTSFPKTQYFNPEKTLVVGHPILKELLEGNSEVAKDIFNLTTEKPVLLFWGGSQGAQPLNDFILNMLADLVAEYEVIHVCGKKNHQQVEAESQVILNKDQQMYYHLWEFLDEIPLKHALAAANFVVSRAGAGSIFEIAACGKPSVLVPLPSSAQNHQSKNAYEYARNKATLVIEQENLNPHFFLAKLHYLFSHQEELEEMKSNALAFSKPLAAKAIAREILEYLR
jgi:UDP-N-acetylglucosamine--N-acetylmuramyl-(pentapeptide) pyrophosphoryl-undecaprenol N-acetylglucosamine transferase